MLEIFKAIFRKNFRLFRRETLSQRRVGNLGQKRRWFPKAEVLFAVGMAKTGRLPDHGLA